MSKSSSVSRSVAGGTISVDASYAQELVEFWIDKYERVKGELDQTKVRVPPDATLKTAEYIPLTTATTLTRTPPLLLPRHLETALTTRATGRTGVDRAPSRSSKSRIITN